MTGDYVYAQVGGKGVLEFGYRHSTMELRRKSQP